MPAFQTIHTNYGLLKMAAAEASGIAINLTQMAVGDGNGNDTTPAEGQTILVREMYRATVNRVFQDPDNAKLFTAELVIPASVGGFTLREVGIFDSDGGLFAVGNLPATYKPTSAEGAFADTIVRLQFLVSNASVVTLQVDPNVAVATQQWITNNVTAAFLLPGGLTGQVLTKQSNADGDTHWTNLTDVSVTVNSIEEIQTLASGQTTVNLSTVTTNGLAVYVEGVRLEFAAGADGWQRAAVPNDQTRIILGSAYPAGSKIILAQNEPAGTAPDPLLRGQNFADVLDKPTARTNLDVYSRSETDAKGPVSEVAYFARNTAPAGWLKANGAAVSRTAYAALFAAIGTTFGAGDGFNTFNLPDLRGEFLRGWDDARGVDAGRTFGGAQTDMLKSHTHSVNVVRGVLQSNASSNTNEGVWGTSTTGATGGTETRPRNIALLACIKF